MKIYTTSRFERRLETFVRSHQKMRVRVKEIMQEIGADPFHPRLKTHKLSGLLRGCYSAKINYETRIIFIIDRDGVCFIDIGLHDHVY